MGETLVDNESFEAYDGDYIELNDLNLPLGINDQFMEDFKPEIEEGEVVDIPKINMINTKNYDEFEGYPSFCDYDRRIHVDCAYNLQFPCMIGYKQISANFFPVLPINVTSKTFYNSIMKKKVEYRGKNVVGAFINVPILLEDLLLLQISQ
jgi:hypothetical protein